MAPTYELRRLTDDLKIEVTGNTPLDVSAQVSTPGTYAVREVSSEAPQNITIVNSVTPEAFATEHWLFGNDNGSHVGLKGAATLSVAGSGVTTDTNFIRAQGIGNGLVSTVADAANITFCIVVNRTVEQTVFGGTLSEIADGGWSPYYFGGNYDVRARGGTDIQRLENTPADDWAFIAVSLNSSGDYVYFRGDQTASVVVSGNTTAHSIAARNIAIGNVHYNSGSFSSADANYAELIVSQSYQDATALEAIYQRSITRMADRSITLQ